MGPRLTTAEDDDVEGLDDNVEGQYHTGMR